MNVVSRVLFKAPAILVLAVSAMNSAHAQQRIAIEDRFTDVVAIKLHYLFAGRAFPSWPSSSITEPPEKNDAPGISEVNR